jgi:hypothetical protein
MINESKGGTGRLFGRPGRRPARCFFWIDNLAAKYGLQKAYSKVDDSGRIINSFKVRQAALKLSAHFEYIPSEQNIADLPSRGAFSAMYDVIREATGSQLSDESLVEWHDFTLPDFSTWDSPLGQPRKRNYRSGSRGAKRRKKASHGAAS